MVKEALSSGTDPQKIIVASLTRTAAKEAARVVGLPDKQVGTWHSFAYHALGRPVLAESHLAEWNEQAPKQWALSQACGLGRGSGETADFDPKGWQSGDKYMLSYGRHRAQLRCAALPQDTKAFALAWEDWKTQCGYLDFHDIIDRAATDVACAPGRPEYIFVDECQDLSLAEASLVCQWGTKCRAVVLAGDFHQSIFGWRGSDPVATHRFWVDRDENDVFEEILTKSHRVPQEVHTVAMRQMGRCTSLKPVKYYPRDFEGTVQTGPPFNQAAPLVRRAMVDTQAGKTVMFLASCGYMLDPVIKELQQVGIPWHNPWRVTNGRWNPLAVSRGLSFKDRCSLFMQPSNTWGEFARLWSLADVKAWAQPLKAKDIFVRGGKTALASYSRRLTEREVIEHLRDWFEPDALEHIRQLDLNWYVQHAAEKKMSHQLLTRVLDRQGVQALREDPRVIVGTVHSLKGSEADVVYVCPDLSEAAVEAARANRRWQQEIYRIFYVAVTRAKETLVLCQPATNRYMGI